MIGHQVEPVASGDQPRRGRLHFAVTLAETLVSTLVIFFLLHTFVGLVYAVEQTSMEPTLEPAQRLIVDRLTPRFDPYKPGDIVVFDARGLPELEAPLIKRVIAIEGSVVELVDGRVFVDGAPLDEPYTYGDEATYPATGQTRWLVPPGQLFVLGDHRAVSLDSRTFGPIEISTVIGRAWLRFLPLEDAALLTSRGDNPPP
jgi:signal peptidase I